MKKEKLHNFTFVFSFIVRSLPKKTKFLLHISKNCLSLQFSTLTENTYIELIKYSFSIRQNIYTQNSFLLLHKSTLNKMDVSTCTTLKFKSDYCVCFAKLLQEYLLQSAHPSLKIKIKKEKLHNLTFLIFYA